VSRRIVIAYWLIPAEPAHSSFQALIDELAQKHDAPVFEPHVTVFVEENHPDGAQKALSIAAGKCRPINLKLRGIDHSDEFIKTLFVQCALTTQLRQLNETIRGTARDSLHYDLKPHLSLLYKTMPATARRNLAASISVPYSKVNFDTIKAVRCVSPTQTRADVERWRVIGSAELRC
jgi:2'-5' RNA ligase